MRISEGLKAKFISAGIAVVSGIYLLQLLSPLRLNNDVIVFLSLAESAYNGQGFLYQGLPTHYPFGYPALLVILHYFGWANSAGFIALNLIFLAIGHLSCYYIFKCIYRFDRISSLALILLTLLSYIFIKHLTLAVSDIAFYGLSMFTIVILHKASITYRNIRASFLMLGLALIVMVTLIRSIGIAFVPVYLLALLSRRAKDKIYYFVFKGNLVNKIIIVPALFLCLIGILYFMDLKYINEAANEYAKMGGFIGAIKKVFMVKITGLGEIAINIPHYRLPATFLPAVVTIGILVLLILLLGLSQSGNMLLLKVYLVIYLMIILLWPYGDSRFWLPVIPLIFATIFQVLLSLTSYQMRSILFGGLMMVYIVFGVLSLGYSSRITLAGIRFPELYADGKLKETYNFIYKPSSVTNPAEIDEEAVRLFKRYN